jgi:ubiquinone/menaquinone biosynthesis C-methylase UbiE
MKKSSSQQKKSSSWEPASQWYKNLVGDEGHYYHQNIILPGVLRLLSLKGHKDSRLLDLACGSGVLARQLPSQVNYTGIDISPTLIKEAKKLDTQPLHQYFVADATKQLPLGQQKFSHATIILALQNIQNPLLVFQNAAKYLQNQGKLVIVLNHPCFRIPRQSFWQIDEAKKLQYRRIDRYFSPLEIPIQTHPSKGEQSSQLISYHYPLSTYCHALKEAGFIIVDVEEWCSNKVSTGAQAKMENRSRDEFPLFLTICAQKNVSD